MEIQNISSLLEVGIALNLAIQFDWVLILLRKKAEKALNELEGLHLPVQLWLREAKSKEDKAKGNAYQREIQNIQKDIATELSKSQKNTRFWIRVISFPILLALFTLLYLVSFMPNLEVNGAYLFWLRFLLPLLTILLPIAAPFAISSWLSRRLDDDLIPIREKVTKAYSSISFDGVQAKFNGSDDKGDPSGS